MRVLRFVIPVIIIASLVILPMIAESTRASDNDSDIAYSTAAPQAKMLFPDSSDALQAQNGLVADSGLLDSSRAILSEPAMPNDPYFDDQWALKRIEAPGLWSRTMGNQEVLVAVLDTGIDRNHEDLSHQVVAEVNFTDSPTLDDMHGHGTHIAGIIAAHANNGIGIAGMAPESRLMNVKVADDKGRCLASAVARGIIWATDNGASVINVSIEIKEFSLEIEAAVSYAWSHGAVIVAAAGNDGSQSPVSPAYHDKCIAVAATKQDDTLAPLSNYGDWVDVAAPGFNIYSTLPGNGYGYKIGTSFATAYVSGLAALFFDVVSDTNGDGKLNDEVRAAIEAGTQNIGISGVGAGRIDSANSLVKIGYTY